MIKRSFINKIRHIAGKRYVREDLEDRICYSFDATPRTFLPDLVVSPRTEEEIAAIIGLAAEEDMPVIPRGAGTGFAGGSLTVQGGISLSCARMDSVIEIDERNLFAVVEPGVINSSLQEEVEKKGLFYPPDPSSLNISTIGGNVATCAGGPRAVKYGVTKDYVTGLNIVLPDATLLHTGGKILKGVVGYDLTKLMVGSEGTLGVITKVIVRLIPKPPFIRTIFVSFSKIEDAAQSVIDIMTAKIVPSCLEFMDKGAVGVVKDFLDLRYISKDEAVLLIEVDGEKEAIGAQMEKIVSIVKRNRSSHVDTAGDDIKRQRLWAARRSISPALRKLGLLKINEDIAVPRAAIVQVLKSLKDISERYGIMIINFGHAGDGNIHVNIMIDEKDSRQMEYKDKVVSDVFDAALEAGGTISGEHGVGIAKKDYINRELGDKSITLMKGIKRVFDPKYILNPGKLF